MSKDQHIQVEGRQIKLSNLDKVLYPAAGFTKAHVIDYYVRVAGVLLPHLKGRPVTMKRYPDGVAGSHFYEKNAPSHTPAWVEIFPVPRRGVEAPIRYILINNLPTLVWSANLANLEIHPFLHRAPEIGTPTEVVFDLDPGEGADVMSCADVAFLLKEKLDGLGLAAYAKVSGSKGMQISVPLNTPATYEVTRPFAHGLAEVLAREHPDRIVSEMAKELRKGKVFIDWSQNAETKTTVGVYSLRAQRAHPFVSLPVAWEELKAARKKGDAGRLFFEPDAALKRLETTGDLFAPVLTQQQRLPVDVGKALSSPTSAPRRIEKSKIEFVEPMLAKAVENLPEGPQWRYELKLDGYRAFGIKSGGKVALLSRRNHDLNERFPRVAKALDGLEDGTMVDGEVVALDSQGKPSFQDLQNHRSSAQQVFYYVFDVLAHRGKSTLELPLSARRELLRAKVFSRLAEPVRLSETIEAGAADLMAAARQQGIEGIIAKRADSRYEAGKRSGAWVKLRLNLGQEMVIGGYIPGSHGFDSLLVGYYEGARLMFAAKIRNGFVPRTREEVFRQFQELETSACPFANLPEPKNARRGEALTAEVMKKCRWLKPELVAQVEYTEWTDAGHLRHAKFLAMRDDKDPHQVVREL